jgi:hypothetical protein
MTATPTKKSILLKLLNRPKGATIDALVKGIGWQPHSVRAALTAHSDESGHRFRRKAATCSDPKRPLWPEVELGDVIVAVGRSFDVISVQCGQRRWR